MTAALSAQGLPQVAAAAALAEMIRCATVSAGMMSRSVSEL